MCDNQRGTIADRAHEARVMLAELSVLRSPEGYTYPPDEAAHARITELYDAFAGLIRDLSHASGMVDIQAAAKYARDRMDI